MRAVSYVQSIPVVGPVITFFVGSIIFEHVFCEPASDMQD